MLIVRLRARRSAHGWRNGRRRNAPAIDSPRPSRSIAAIATGAVVTSGRSAITIAVAPPQSRVPVRTRALECEERYLGTEAIMAVNQFPSATAPRWRGVNHLALVTSDMDETVRF